MSIDFYKIIHDEIRRQRLTQAEFGRRAGLTEARVSDFLRQRRSANQETLRRMFNALGLTVRSGNAVARKESRKPKD